MKATIFIFLYSIVLIVANDVFEVNVDPSHRVATEQPTAKSSIKFGPQPTHQPPITSTPAPNTTSTSTTTTPKPTTKSTTTTTPPPPTPPSPNTTTTTTTTTATPPTTSTTVRPTPHPINPPINNYTFNYTTTNKNESKVCFLMAVAIQLEIPSKNSSINSTKINVPENVSVVGQCKPGEHVENLTLNWDNYEMDLGFNKTNGKYDLDRVYFFKNGTTYVFNQTLFVTSIDKSYKCFKDQTFNLTAENSTVLLHLSHLQYQAFMNNTKNQFDTAIDCQGASITTDVVPIVVGCVLAILVILVLVAYLYGRRRSQAGGYLSMFTRNKNESDYIPMKTLSCFS